MTPTHATIADAAEETAVASVTSPSAVVTDAPTRRTTATAKRLVAIPAPNVISSLLNSRARWRAIESSAGSASAEIIYPVFINVRAYGACGMFVAPNLFGSFVRAFAGVSGLEGLHRDGVFTAPCRIGRAGEHLITKPGTVMAHSQSIRVRLAARCVTR
ncbi:MAG: hypothetical protein ABI442_04545 [Gemmatimonadaceae bacterium]